MKVQIPSGQQPVSSTSQEKIKQTSEIHHIAATIRFFSMELKSNRTPRSSATTSTQRWRGHSKMARIPSHAYGMTHRSTARCSSDSMGMVRHWRTRLRRRSSTSSPATCMRLHRRKRSRNASRRYWSDLPLVIPWLLAGDAQRMHTDPMHSYSVIQIYRISVYYSPLCPDNIRGLARLVWRRQSGTYTSP